MKKQGPIIIIEDDIDEQYLYRRTFKKLNITNQVIFFSNGKEAFDYLQGPDSDPFLILSDINMPLMNGMELRKAMCENQSILMKNTPFIFMSTSAIAADIEQARELYIQGFFKKEATLEKQELILSLIIHYWNNCRLLEN